MRPDPRPTHAPHATPARDPGTLTLVATPIGNLADMPPRGLAALAAADLVLCEDTRVTAKLLTLQGVKARLQRCDDHRERDLIEQVVARLRAGQAVALVSDAGTPLISDPGYALVRAVQAAGLSVTATPGPAAPILALILSGLPSDRFYFGGFLPPKSSARQAALHEIRTLQATSLFFEAPRRLVATLHDAAAVLGGHRAAATARELTKKFEEMQTGTVESLGQHYSQRPVPKGELVLLFGPAPKQEDQGDLDTLLRAALTSQTVSEAARGVAKRTKLPKSQVYARALELRHDQPDENTR